MDPRCLDYGSFHAFTRLSMYNPQADDQTFLSKSGLHIWLLGFSIFALAWVVGIPSHCGRMDWVPALSMFAVRNPGMIFGVVRLASDSFCSALKQAGQFALSM